MHIITKLVHGSHLYGTNTEKSDKDYKGVYIPTVDEYFTQTVKKTITNNTNNSNTKNTAEDVDDQLFSLNYFLELCLAGDTYAIDVLHAPTGWEDITSPIWEDLKSKRHLFYSKNLKSFIGYCKQQAAKYGLKGFRLEVAGQLKDFADNNRFKETPYPTIPKHERVVLKKFNKTEAKYGFYNLTRIYDFWNQLPELEYTKKEEVFLEDGTIDYQNSFFHIFGKRFAGNDHMNALYECMDKFHSEFGVRAELAKQNKGVDWKAISHAFRAGYQLKEILQTGDLKYPLKDRDFLLQIKTGNLHYIEDGVAEQLEQLVEEIRVLSDSSSLPDFPDVDYWNTWLASTLKEHFKIQYYDK